MPKTLMIRAGAVLLLAVDQSSGFVGTSRRHKAPSSRYGCASRCVCICPWARVHLDLMALALVRQRSWVAVAVVYCFDTFGIICYKSTSNRY